MTTYSEDALRKLNKDNLIGIALNLQSKMEYSNAKVLEELSLLNEKFDKLEPDVAIPKNANSLLSSRLVDSERQCWANTQYSRKETLEIAWLPKALINDKAETKVCQSLDCNVDKEDLDACYRLKDKERVIVKFCRRKDCEKVWKAKNDLRKLDSTNLDLPERSKFSINQSLCSYYRLLWSTSKKLDGKGRIFGWYVSKGQLR